MNLITNRQQNSVYEYTDLNRVESAVAQIAALLPELGIKAEMKTKTDWGLPGDFSADSWPVAHQMARYLSNVEKIKELFPSTAILPVTMDNLTWIGANNIEKVLQVAFERISGIQNAYRYSGELFAGEE